MQDEYRNKLIFLKQKRQEINKIMYAKKELVDAQYLNILNCNNGEKKIEFYNKIIDLRSDIECYENQIENIDNLILKEEMKNWNLVSFNSKLDLYKLDTDLAGDYYIYLHDTIKEVGLISYNPKYKDTIYGDISYYIDEEYQGNGYAFEALCMLTNYLKNKKVYSIRISVKNYNVPSIKTVEKYEQINSDVVVSDCDGNNIYDFTLRKRIYKR